MRKIILIVILLITQIIASQNQKDYQIGSPKNSFIKNEGQIIDQNGNFNNQVLYLLNTPGLNVQLRRDGFSYDVYEKQFIEVKSQAGLCNKPVFKSLVSKNNCDPLISEKLFHRVDINFLGCSKFDLYSL
jgi:hypothetical protein